MQNYRRVIRTLIVGLAVLCLFELGALAQAQSDQASSGTQAQSEQSSQTSQSKAKKSAKQASQTGAAQMSSEAAAGKLARADHQFVMKAAQGNVAEVELGRLATQKAQSDDVKKFGQRMVDEHAEANDRLQKIASRKGITLPTSLDKANQAVKDRLSKLSGEQFDRAYMRHMVSDHRKDVAEFEREANSGKDEDVKKFASRTLPTLEDHLNQAESLSPEKAQPAMSEKPPKKSAVKPSTPPQ